MILTGTYLLFEPGKDVQILKEIPYPEDMTDGNCLYASDSIGTDWMQADSLKMSWEIIDPATVPEEYRLHALLHT